MSKKQPFRPDRIAVAGPVTDEEMRQIIRQQANQAEGLCPNGCEPLVWDDDYNAHCPSCGFHLWQNTPHSQDETPAT